MSGPNEFPGGVVTLLQWTMMPDGCTYMHIWAESWEVVTDKATGIENFRSSEKWHLVHRDGNGVPDIIIPGCQVKGFAACESNPSLKGGPQAYAPRIAP